MYICITNRQNKVEKIKLNNFLKEENFLTPIIVTHWISINSGTQNITIKMVDGNFNPLCFDINLN